MQYGRLGKTLAGQLSYEILIQLEVRLEQHRSIGQRQLKEDM